MLLDLAVSSKSASKVHNNTGHRKNLSAKTAIWKRDPQQSKCVLYLGLANIWFIYFMLHILCAVASLHTIGVQWLVLKTYIWFIITFGQTQTTLLRHTSSQNCIPREWNVMSNSPSNNTIMWFVDVVALCQ
jgi:hypothetical protein